MLEEGFPEAEADKRVEFVNCDQIESTRNLWVCESDAWNLVMSTIPDKGKDIIVALRNELGWRRKCMEDMASTGADVGVGI